MVDGDGRNPASPNGWLKPYKSWAVFTTYQLVIRISQPSAVFLAFVFPHALHSRRAAIWQCLRCRAEF